MKWIDQKGIPVQSVDFCYKCYVVPFGLVWAGSPIRHSFPRIKRLRKGADAG